MSRVDDLFRSDFHISAKSRLEIVQERITHRLFLLRFEKEPVDVIPDSGENRTRRVSNHIRPIMLKSFPQIIERRDRDRKSTRLNSSHSQISYAVFCLKKKITYSLAHYSHHPGQIFMPAPLLGPAVRQQAIDSDD